MSYVITLVAAENNLSAGHLAKTEHLLEDQGIAMTGEPSWLAEHNAADIPVAECLNGEQMTAFRDSFSQDKLDIFCLALQNRRKKLLIADMDSTIVTSETLDELAEEAGIKDKIAPITEKAMRGELDFKGALRERVALLKNLPADALERTLKRTTLSPGAEQLVKTMRYHDARCILVSGGFTYFTGAIQEQAGFHAAHGNILEIDNDVLTGSVQDPILDKDSKLSLLKQYSDELGISPQEAIALGDGANDLPMLENAGLGIGYHPKPLLQESLLNCILHGDLSAALYAQGYKEEDFFAE